MLRLCVCWLFCLRSEVVRCFCLLWKIEGFYLAYQFYQTKYMNKFQQLIWIITMVLAFNGFIISFKFFAVVSFKITTKWLWLDIFWMLPLIRVIGCIAGTNKFASQKGMSMGAVRHVADIRADEMDQDGQGLVCLQSGNYDWQAKWDRAEVD